MPGPGEIPLTQWEHDGWSYTVYARRCTPSSRETAMLSQAASRCPKQHHRMRIPPAARRVDPFEDQQQSIGRLRSRSTSAEHTDFDSAAFIRMYGVRGRLYAACPNSGTCDNTIVRMRSNMFWCTKCWKQFTQEEKEQCHIEANATAEQSH